MTDDPKIYNGPSLGLYKTRTTYDSATQSHIQHVIFDGATQISASGVLQTQIKCSNSGANIIVAANTTKKIVALRYAFSSAGTVTATWRSGTDEINGPWTEITATGVSEPYCPVGIMQTAINKDLILYLSDAIGIGGSLTYILV